jgi:N-acetylmuramoyl-L-alanine amidase
MDPGAVYQDLREADLTRDIAKRVVPYIEKAKVEVKAVPLDLPLFQRLEWINATGFTEEAGDLCLEVHVNDGNKRGVEGWHKGAEKNRSYNFGKTVIDTICKETGYTSQGIHSEFEHELGQLTFLNQSRPTTTIVETLYIDNPEDNKLLRDPNKLEELAKAIAKGILKFIGKDMDGNELPENEKVKTESDTSTVAASATTAPVIAPTTQVQPVTSSPAPAVTPAPTPTFGSMGGGLSGGLGGGFGGGMGGFTPGLGGVSSNMMADREQRKEAIKKNYIKILGREPSSSDSNYFLNMGITEDQLVRKMVDSQEHLEIVKGKRDLEELKKKFADLERENLKLKTEAKDREQMLTSLNQLLDHKNQAIASLEQRFRSEFGMPSAVVKEKDREKDIKEELPRLKRGRLDAFFHYLTRFFK